MVEDWNYWKIEMTLGEENSSDDLEIWCRISVRIFDAIAHRLSYLNNYSNFKTSLLMMEMT